MTGDGEQGVGKQLALAGFRVSILLLTSWGAMAPACLIYAPVWIFSKTNKSAGDRSRVVLELTCSRNSITFVTVPLIARFYESPMVLYCFQNEATNLACFPSLNASKMTVIILFSSIVVAFNKQ